MDTLNLDEAIITPEAELEKDLGINSLDMYELVNACEDAFGIEIDEDKARTFITVSDLVRFLEEQKSA